MCHSATKCKNAVMFHSTTVKHAHVMMFHSITAQKNAETQRSGYATRSATMFLATTTDMYALNHNNQLLPNSSS